MYGSFINTTEVVYLRLQATKKRGTGIYLDTWCVIPLAWKNPSASNIVLTRDLYASTSYISANFKNSVVFFFQDTRDPPLVNVLPSIASQDEFQSHEHRLDVKQASPPPRVSFFLATTRSLPLVRPVFFLVRSLCSSISLEAVLNRPLNGRSEMISTRRGKIVFFFSFDSQKFRGKTCPSPFHPRSQPY